MNSWISRKLYISLILEPDEISGILMLPQMERTLSLRGWTLACSRVAWHWQVSTFLSLLSTLSAADWCISPRLTLTYFTLQKTNLKQFSVHGSGRIFHRTSPHSCWWSSFMAVRWASWWQVGVWYPGCGPCVCRDTPKWNGEWWINLALSRTLPCSTCCTHTTKQHRSRVVLMNRLFFFFWGSCPALAAFLMGSHSHSDLLFWVLLAWYRPALALEMRAMQLPRIPIRQKSQTRYRPNTDPLWSPTSSPLLPVALLELVCLFVTSKQKNMSESDDRL